MWVGNVTVGLLPATTVQRALDRDTELSAAQRTAAESASTQTLCSLETTGCTERWMNAGSSETTQRASCVVQLQTFESISSVSAW